ncbi:hypothetical protein U1872_00665 [Sphingomonas sp. RB3P16]|uniref:hypothetical protein n=1 Tax=Parasphingomonas frigoris TaxID=3096163 RepID=UPI002FC9511C
MATTQRKRDQRQLVTGGIIAWAILISLFFLWESVNYSGAMALLAEWQFNVFGSFYPSATYLVLIALLASPGLLLFLRVRKRESDQRLGLATLRSAIVFRRVLLGTGAACLAAAAATLLLILTLPTSVGPPQRIDLARPVISLPSEGPSTIDGAILYDRVAAFNEDVIVAHHNVRYAPIVAPGSSSTTLQFFVELPPETAPRATGTTSMTGVLKRDGLPGEIVRLYRYAGFTVEPPYYVLFASDHEMRWPYIELAIELGIGALVFLVFGAWQHRRVRWFEKALAPPEPPLTEA